MIKDDECGVEERKPSIASSDSFMELPKVAKESKLKILEGILKKIVRKFANLDCNHSIY